MSVNQSTLVSRFPLAPCSIAVAAVSMFILMGQSRGQESGLGVHADARGLALRPTTVQAIYRAEGLPVKANVKVKFASATGEGEPAKIPSSAKSLPLTESSRKVKRLPSKSGIKPKSGDSPKTVDEAPSYEESDGIEPGKEAGESEAFKKILQGEFQGKQLGSSNSLRQKQDFPQSGLKFSDESAENEPLDLEAATPIPDELRKQEEIQKEFVPKKELPSKSIPVSKSIESSSDSKNCPGSPVGEYFENPPQPDDIEVEQEDHPYDAPAAESISDDSELEPSYGENESFEELTSSQLATKNAINRCLQHYLENPENVARRGPWALMHASLPFGVEAEIIAGRQRVNALGWMCYNGVCAKQRMFQATRYGFRPNVGPGVQGHEGQFLAILAQSQVNADYEIRVGRRKFTIRDLVKHEQLTCRERSELTFKLIGLAYYLPQDAKWRDNRGRTWNLEKMVAEELAQPINGAACGGTHRLMGLSFAVIERQKAGLPITGYWAKAEKYLNDYVNYAMTLQNPDGSFSTEWFESRGQDQDVERKVQTTGHILEWLIYTLPDEHLHSPRIEKSVKFLLNTVGTDLRKDWPIGPRGHALRALSLYSQRVLGAEPGAIREFIADSGQGSSGSYR